MTIEERATKLIEKLLAVSAESLRRHDAEAFDRQLRKVVDTLRDQIRECAKVAAEVKNHPRTSSDSDLKYCAGLIERRILALAEPSAPVTDPDDSLGFFPGFPPGFDPKRAEQGLAQVGGDSETAQADAETGQIYARRFRRRGRVVIFSRDDSTT